MKFAQFNGIIEYENPFDSSSLGQQIFQRHNPRIFEIENAMIVKVCDEQFDYLVNGNLITQRCGASKELLEKLVNHNVKAKDYDLMFKILKCEV